MKCFFVVNQLNNPIFIDFDAEFTKFIQKKAVEIGLQDPNQVSDSSEVDVAVVTQLFSPLVLSQVPLDDQVQNPCTSVTCPNGFLLVFKKVDDMQYITISGDKADTEDFLQRKIQIFIRLTKFLFGPLHTEISNCSSAEKTARWNFLKGLLRHWTQLAHSDQSYLVEAIERLHVNQLVSEKCMGLLEKTVHRMQASADRPTQHAFLLVNTKLLALYSKRTSFELQASDILLTMLLVRNLFPCRDELVDLLASSSVQSHRSHSDLSAVPSTPANAEVNANREERSDENEEFHSAPTTPSQFDSEAADNPFNDNASDQAGAPQNDGTGEQDASVEQSEGDEKDEWSKVEREEGGLDRLMTPSSQTGRLSAHKASVSSGNKGSTTSSSARERAIQTASLLSDGQYFPRKGKRSLTSTVEGKYSNVSQETSSEHSSLNPEVGTLSSGRSRSGTEQSMQSMIMSQVSVTTDYWPHSVFLQTPSCQHSPHALHCAQILPGITLIVVSQMSGYAAAEPLCQVLAIMQDLVQGRRNKLSRQQSLQVHDVVADLIRRAHTITRKIKKKARNSAADALSWWENSDLRDKLVNFLQQDEHSIMPPDLESPLLELQRRLREAFRQFFVVPGWMSGGEGAGGDSLGEVMSQMKVRLQQELMDYRDYLSIKAQRNITMTSYLNDFPGLVHFIYIDRQFHQMTAPCFNLMSDTTFFLKDKIWTMYGYMMKKLQQGYTSVLLRDGDFYYSYFLWFEDNMGNPIPVEEPFKPGIVTPQPGILTGSFYKRLVRQCFPSQIECAVHCYEMFLMHIGLVTPPYITAHCQKLANKLWEMSGEAYTPINLL